ncbi:hypothetical protein BH09SUM1_BH09SUM1_28670 [soil metagenome]
MGTLYFIRSFARREAEGFRLLLGAALTARRNPVLPFVWRGFFGRRSILHVFFLLILLVISKWTFTGRFMPDMSMWQYSYMTAGNWRYTMLFMDLCAVMDFPYYWEFWLPVIGALLSRKFLSRLSTDESFQTVPDTASMLVKALLLIIVSFSVLPSLIELLVWPFLFPLFIGPEMDQYKDLHYPLWESFTSSFKTLHLRTYQLANGAVYPISLPAAIYSEILIRLAYILDAGCMMVIGYALAIRPRRRIVGILLCIAWVFLMMQARFPFSDFIPDGWPIHSFEGPWLNGPQEGEWNWSQMDYVSFQLRILWRLLFLIPIACLCASALQGMLSGKRR